MSRLLAVKATLRVTRGGKMALCSTLPARFRVQRILDPCKFASDEIELKMGVKSAILAVSTPLKIPSASRSWRKKNELAIMTETPNYHRIWQLGRIFIEFYNGNLVLAIPPKDVAVDNGNPCYNAFDILLFNSFQIADMW